MKKRVEASLERDLMLINGVAQVLRRGARLTDSNIYESSNLPKPGLSFTGVVQETRDLVTVLASTALTEGANLLNIRINDRITVRPSAQRIFGVDENGRKIKR